MRTPKAFSIRRAISTDNAERSFRRDERAGRVTPNALAATVMETPNGLYDFGLDESPGMRRIFLSVAFRRRHSRLLQ